MAGKSQNRRLERLVNLTFAFIYAEQFGSKVLTSEWIRNNVDGYKDKSDEAFERMFARDRLWLSQAGVPIEVIAPANSHEFSTGSLRDVPCYRLQQDEYQLPPVQFTTEEATVLGLAGEMGLGQELSTFARSGWTKIAASGATRELGKQANFMALGDHSSLTPKDLDLILTACASNQRIGFYYLPTPTAEEYQYRTMDPWGLVPVRGRLYLTGFDIDRQAPRIFRIAKISEISVEGEATNEQPEGLNLQDLVEEMLKRGEELVDATLKIEANKALELANVGELQDDGSYLLRNVEKHWLVRTAASHAPAALVLEPKEVRDEVIKVLQQSAAGHDDVEGEA